jgi:hypothetical protein
MGVRVGPGDDLMPAGFPQACPFMVGPMCRVVWDHTLSREETGWCSTWPGPWECTTGLRCGYPMGAVWDGAGSTCAGGL